MNRDAENVEGAVGRTVLRVVVVSVLMAVAGWALWPLEPSDASAEEAVIQMEPLVEWHPKVPGEGMLFKVRVIESMHTPIMGLRGEIGGEELHFRKVADRTFESLAAVPVGSVESVTATIRPAYENGGEPTLVRTIPIGAGTYAHERLRVAPRFGSPLNAEDQALLDRDREKARAVARAAHRTPAIASPAVILPRDSRVTSGFGDGREFNGQISSRHMGLDLRGARGDTVMAAAKGVVALADRFLLAGRLVYLNHGAGIVSGYFHLSEHLVSVGDTVMPGTPIGLVGATGRVTGPHLHWVVRYGSTSVDPRSLLDVGLPGH